MKKFIATHRVKNSDNETVGFVVNNRYINNYLVESNITNIDNLRVLKSGVIRASKQLPVIYYKDLMLQEYNRIKNDSPYKRDIEARLNRWKKQRSNKVLQLNGPRQCGKTTELKKFSYKNYEYIVYVDLSDNTGKLFKEVICSNNTNIGAILDSMTVYCERSNLPTFKDCKNTVLIIDEIQLDPSIYNMIRTLRNRYNIDIIVTGSYLGVVVFNKEFFLPAGTIEELHMLPLSFREFVDIFNKSKLLDKISINGQSSKSEYEQIDYLYSIYRQIGGYPDVIKEYIKTKSIRQSMEVVGQIINIFTQESRNYFDADKHDMIFKSLYSSVFIQMCKDKKGSGAKLVEDVAQIIKSGAKMVVSRDEVSKSLLWLVYSKVIGQCDLYVDGDLTNLLPARRFYYLDCGIASYIGNTTGIDKATIEGILTETFAYSELYRLYINTYSLDKVKGNNPSFSMVGDYELDFMILGTDDNIYGIEVKTKAGETKSLKEFIKRGLITKGIIAKKTMGSNEGKANSIPIWAVGCRFPYKE